ncbi:hypothetical protein AcW1_009879 [Taiwanofungus camphoratus]|nr:hypothetical protein AcV7_005232 [Antrodia cinnamomea]KAI0946409.1 hypothetical protein AcW1_009879 [Antrodia cinnamomea]
MTSVESYEILYWPIHGRADVMRMLLEAAGKPYKNKLVNPAEWPALKKQQRYGHVPALVVKYTDGTSKTLWEEVAIDTYLSETLGFFPVQGHSEDASFLKAECLGIYTSWLELSDKFAAAMGLPTLEERQDKIAKMRNDFAKVHVGHHEKLVAERKGPFYFGDKPTLPDFIAVSNYLRMEELFGDGYALEAFPHLVKLKDAVVSIPGVKEYMEKRRDFGVLKFDRKQLQVIPVGK